MRRVRLSGFWRRVGRRSVRRGYAERSVARSRRKPRVALLVGLAMGLSAAGGEPVKVHVVQPGESLWSIAARSDVYDEPFLWPLIYRFNRDQIPDPARIYPQQRLQIPPSTRVRPQGLQPRATNSRSQQLDRP